MQYLQQRVITHILIGFCPEEGVRPTLRRKREGVGNFASDMLSNDVYKSIYTFPFEILKLVDHNLTRCWERGYEF